MTAAGAGLALGAAVAMAAVQAPGLRCGSEGAYTFWAGGLTASTGLLISFAGWGELHRVPRTERTLTRRQRVALPFLILGSALLGAAPVAAGPLLCRRHPDFL